MKLFIQIDFKYSYQLCVKYCLWVNKWKYGDNVSLSVYSWKIKLLVLSNDTVHRREQQI
jgi:hypothetical protein